MQNIDDQYRNPNINNRDHLVRQLTTAPAPLHPEPAALMPPPVPLMGELEQGRLF